MGRSDIFAVVLVIYGFVALEQILVLVASRLDRRRIRFRSGIEAARREVNDSLFGVVLVATLTTLLASFLVGLSVNMAFDSSEGLRGDAGLLLVGTTIAVEIVLIGVIRWVARRKSITAMDLLSDIRAASWGGILLTSNELKRFEHQISRVRARRRLYLSRSPIAGIVGDTPALTTIGQFSSAASAPRRAPDDVRKVIRRKALKRAFVAPPYTMSFLTWVLVALGIVPAIAGSFAANFASIDYVLVGLIVIVMSLCVYLQYALGRARILAELRAEAIHLQAIEHCRNALAALHRRGRCTTRTEDRISVTISFPTIGSMLARGRYSLRSRIGKQYTR